MGKIAMNRTKLSMTDKGTATQAHFPKGRLYPRTHQDRDREYPRRESNQGAVATGTPAYRLEEQAGNNLERLSFLDGLPSHLKPGRDQSLLLIT